MDKQEWYILVMSKDEEPSKVYVEQIDFRNQHFKEFKNVTIHFTNDMRYALRIKHKELAEQLKNVVQASVITLKCDVVIIDERWFRV